MSAIADASTVPQTPTTSTCASAAMGFSAQSVTMSARVAPPTRAMVTAPAQRRAPAFVIWRGPVMQPAPLAELVGLARDLTCGACSAAIAEVLTEEVRAAEAVAEAKVVADAKAAVEAKVAAEAKAAAESKAAAEAHEAEMVGLARNLACGACDTAIKEILTEKVRMAEVAREVEKAHAVDLADADADAEMELRRQERAHEPSLGDAQPTSLSLQPSVPTPNQSIQPTMTRPPHHSQLSSPQ